MSFVLSGQEILLIQRSSEIEKLCAAHRFKEPLSFSTEFSVINYSSFRLCCAQTYNTDEKKQKRGKSKATRNRSESDLADRTLCEADAQI